MLYTNVKDELKKIKTLSISIHIRADTPFKLHQIYIVLFKVIIMLISFLYLKKVFKKIHLSMPHVQIEIL